VRPMRSPVLAGLACHLARNQDVPHVPWHPLRRSALVPTLRLGPSEFQSLDFHIARNADGLRKVLDMPDLLPSMSSTNCIATPLLYEYYEIR
jgi:hypothetical protein